MVLVGVFRKQKLLGEYPVFDRYRDYVFVDIPRDFEKNIDKQDVKDEIKKLLAKKGITCKKRNYHSIR